ncbi:MAG: hypothetical protein RR513_09360 [Muribaculaceae bacterium]
MENENKITDSIDIIDEIHRIAHSGALDNCSPEVIDNIADKFKDLIDVKIDSKYAQKNFGITSSTWRQTLHRKFIKGAIKIRENTSLIPYSEAKRLFKK